MVSSEEEQTHTSDGDVSVVSIAGCIGYAIAVSGARSGVTMSSEWSCLALLVIAVIVVLHAVVVGMLDLLI